MRILAIETSCDETAIAIAEFRSERRHTRTRSRTDADKNVRIKVLSHIISSQVKIHTKFGGVVPNLAKREHQKNLAPILISSLKESKLYSSSPISRGIKKNTLRNSSRSRHVGTRTVSLVEKILEREPELLEHFKKKILPLVPPKIDAIAVTYGPGLAPALWVGVNFARALAYLWDKPLIPVNHMAGHLYSAFLRESRVKNLQPITYNVQSIKFPTLALLVSGNHTELVLARGHGKFKIIGETLDDAAGEAFDKVARIMGFPYPGGPAISRLAEKGSPKRYLLPSPMLHSKDYNFSFSGLKTATLYLIRDITGSMSWKTKTKLTAQQKADIAASFEKATIDVLVKKTIRAAKEYNVKTIALGGGVAANKKLRQKLGEALQKELPQADYFVPDFLLTGDNALMIATAAYFTGRRVVPTQVGADANASV